VRPGEGAGHRTSAGILPAQAAQLRLQVAQLLLGGLAGLGLLPLPLFGGLKRLPQLGVVAQLLGCSTSSSVSGTRSQVTLPSGRVSATSRQP
jgi:hypothetical protein